MKRNWMRVSGSLLVGCLLAGLLPVKAAAVTFQDVPANHWARESINRCVEQGFFQGQSATTFGLGQTMTRSAAAVVLDRFFGWEDAELSLPYEDVPADAWYVGALRSAYAKGAVTGQNKQFRPSDPITREELAVMLIRALGYTGLAGVAQELPQTFADVTSNSGYITMARDLGLLSGTKWDIFSPDKYATREQMAVILMRLYDKLQAEKPDSMGIVTSAAEVAELDRVAIPAYMVLGDGKVNGMLAAEVVAEIREAATEELVYISVMAGVLNRDVPTVVETVRRVVVENDYAGVVLEMENLSAKYRKKLTEFVTLLHEALGERTLELVLPVPQRELEKEWQSGVYEYAALSRAADRFVLQLPQTVKMNNGIAVAPLEIPEEIYWNIMLLQDYDITSENITLMLTAAGTKYSGKQKVGTLAAAQIQALLEEKDSEWTAHYSARYGCAYLEHEEEDEIIWYLDEQGAADRMQMFKLLGIGGVCLDQPADVSAGVLAVFQ